MKYLVANLKANMTYKDIVTYVPLLENVKKPGVIICPSTLFIPYFLGNGYAIGLQDISSYPKGSYTGEMTAEQVMHMGIEYVILGHSERRKYQKETNDIIKQKINRALEQNLKVILCIGEDTGESKKRILEEQLEILQDIPLTSIMVAYEPIWAIGTGKIPSNEEIEQSIRFIKELIFKKYHYKIEVLYGGSVTSENFSLLNKIHSLDGVLVGKASIDSQQLLKMISEL